jgi:catechol 2,3-dioxygenase-like lactoylglutathione lyase family enzyme
MSEKHHPSQLPPGALGAFSLSLSVKDLQVSIAFYEKLGFSKLGGDGENFIILQSGQTVIGLFQGMFEGNMMTFNPGWDQNGGETEAFTDLRYIQKRLKAEGVVFDQEADEGSTGRAMAMLKDPDGNVILFDQHR